MIGNTDKPGHAERDRFWLISIFFIALRSKGASLCYGLTLFITAGFGQCPGNEIFRDKITAVYNSPVKKNDARLKELLALQQQMEGCKVSRDSSYMFLLQKIGVLYSRQTDYIPAIDFTIRSIGVAKECIRTGTCNTLSLVDDYYNLFYYYGLTAQPEKKYQAIDSCIVYALKGNSGFDLVIAPLDDKSEYLFNKGEYSQCSRDAKLGEEIIRKYYHEKDSISYIVIFVTRQANALYISRNIPTAEKLLQDRIVQFERSGNRDQLGPFYTLLGLINRDKHNYPFALECFNKAYRANSAIKFRKGRAINLGYMGILQAKNFGQYTEGLRYCASALGYATDASDSLFVLQQTGDIYMLMREFDKAQSFFQRSYNTIQPGMTEITMLQRSFQYPGFNLLQYLCDLTTDKGDAYVGQYHLTNNRNFLEKALAVYKSEDLFLAKIKADQNLQFNSNLVWRNTARNLYEHALAACDLSKSPGDAFYFFEKSRAILLNDQINEQRSMSDVDIAKQASLKQNITKLERELGTVPASSAEYFAIQEKLNSGYPALDKLTREIKKKNPLFYQNHLDTSSLTIAQLRNNILNNSASLIEIFSGDSAVYVLTISPSRQSLKKINKHSYDSLTSVFNSIITDPDKINGHFNEFVRSAHQLHALLFQDNPPPDGRIIISPDGVNYPFEALVTGEQLQAPDYFLNHYATSYTYSAKYLVNEFSGDTDRSNTILGMAPVNYNKYKDLSTLSGSDQSLREINKFFDDGTSYLFGKATKSNFQHDFPAYHIIQLYTHASANNITNDPVIYFEDSALYLSDLVPYRKPVTRLVVLSACETANGKLYEGEGIFNFNRGFAAMGIPASVSNLWSVDNESTYRITELFYKYLAQGIPTDVALQKAKLEFINSSSSNERKLPYFWAGPILTGKVDVIFNPAGFPWRKAFLVLMILLILAYIIRKTWNRW